MRYPQSKICAPRISGQKFAKYFRRMLLNKNPNHAKFCGKRVKTAQDICEPKFVLRENVGQSSPKSLKTYYALRPPIRQKNLSRSVKPAWRKALQNLGLGQKTFVTDGEKRDYLSRDLQCARVATKNNQKPL